MALTDANNLFCSDESAQSFEAYFGSCANLFEFGVELSGRYAVSVWYVDNRTTPLCQSINHALAGFFLHTFFPIIAVNYIVGAQLFKIGHIVESGLRDN